MDALAERVEADQELYQRLLVQPVTGSGVTAQAASVTLVSGPALITSWAWLATAGGAANFDLLDGLDDNGPLIGSFQAGAFSPVGFPIVHPGRFCRTGIRLRINAGSVSGGVFVRVEGREEDRDLEAEIMSQPTINIPINSESVSRILVSGPCAVVGGRLQEPNGAVATWNLLDGLDANGTLLFPGHVAASGAFGLQTPWGGVLCRTGLFLQFVTGTMRGSIQVKVKRPGVSVQDWRELVNAPTVAVPLAQTAASVTVCSGPGIIAGAAFKEPLNALTTFDVLDGLDDKGELIDSLRINGNGTSSNGFAWEGKPFIRGLRVKMTAGSVVGSFLVKLRGMAGDQELYEQLQARPAITVPINSETVSRILVSGPCIVFPWTLLEAVGGTVIFDLLDGLDTNGVLIAPLRAGANGGLQGAGVYDGIFCRAGLFLRFTSGTVKGGIPVKMLDPSQALS